MNLNAMNASLRKQLYEEVRKEMQWFEREAGATLYSCDSWYALKEWLEKKIEREDRRLRGD